MPITPPGLVPGGAFCVVKKIEKICILPLDKLKRVRYSFIIRGEKSPELYRRKGKTMTASTFRLSIAKGTKVLSESRGLVELTDSVRIAGATRTQDGGFEYRLGSERFFASSGCVGFEPDGD